MRLTLKKTLLVVMTACGLAMLSCPAAEGKPDRQVILIMADYLTLHDLLSEEAAFLQEAATRSTVGLMNTGTAHSSRTTPHTQATISAGRPATGSSGNVLAFPASEKIEGETAGSLYTRYTGCTPQDTDVVIINWPQIQRANQNLRPPQPAPGLLGEKLQEAGMAAAVVGNSDTPAGTHRPAALLACDRHGIIPAGQVSQGITKPSAGFLSFRTDYQALLQQTVAAMETAALVVIDTGDLYRLEATQHYGSEEVIRRERRAIIRDINNFYRALYESINPENTLLILASTTPSPAQAQDKNYLVPIIMTNSRLTPGLVYSNTTRRSGLITNTDLTATILSFLGIIPPAQVTGQPVSGVSFAGENPWHYLDRMNREMLFTYQNRPKIIKPYVACQIITIACAAPLFFYGRQFISYYRLVLALMVGVPAALLLVELFTHETLVVYTIILISLTAGLALAAFAPGPDKVIRPFILLSTGTAGLVTADLLAGSFLMKQSLLGYDPIAGARYYGIGNEYMGVLVGSSFMGFGVLFQQMPVPTGLLGSIIYFSLLTWLMFAADFGTNFGGTVALLTSSAYWFWRWQKETIKKRALLWLVLALAGLALMIITGLGLVQDRPSHIGRTVQLVQQGGLLELWYIMLRKLEMNLKLVRYTPWTNTFLAALLAVGILLFKPAGFMKRLFETRRPVYEAAIAILVGSITALVWNDSGIVAAATTMIFAVYPLLSLALSDIDAQGRKG